MKKFLMKADKVAAFFIEHAAAVMTAAIFVIVVVVVIFRFVFRMSSGGFEELPTNLLMMAIWFGAVICARNPKEGLIRIDLLEQALKKKPAAQSVLMVIASIFTLSVIGLYTYLSYQYVVFCVATHQTTLALKIPIWILTGLTFIACALLLIYEIVNFVKHINSLRAAIEARRSAA